MLNVIDMNFRFLENVFLKNDEIFSGENSLVINEIGMLICEEIIEEHSTSEIIKLLEKKYPSVNKQMIVETTENFILSIWKQAIYLNRENDIKICQSYLNVGSFAVLPSFVDVPNFDCLALNFHNGLLIDSLFKDSKLLQIELGYKIFYIGKFDDKGNCTGMLVLEVTRFSDSYIVNSLYGDFTIQFCKENRDEIRRCVIKYFDFFGENNQSIQNMELIYIYNDDNLFDSTLNHIGTLDDEIGSNSLYIYSQKI
ncbi:hypothetical protein MX629_08190 [Carnobacterium divergens]|uniref:Coenzyme PQQ synthesis protein D (PqqD) n=1 Tax=Carnobacterium divergens TaxID=2748 RepID=A0AAW8RDQ0_CARDV|nr:hypothetical protein [Carnobacterium divergens]MDT1958397.1 hypothetical protein [Carnobacterium divergens]MDT1974246.1 hypothetical protein [Carnobacterium divergens]